MQENLRQGPRVPKFIWAGAFIVFVLVVFFGFRSMKVGIPTNGRVLDNYGAVPDFTLTDQTGKPVSLKDLKGKVWVADFIYTECKGPCPLITSRLQEVNQELDKSHKDVRLVSFSVDPENDTPQVLAEYGKSVHADPENWKFLTGTPAEIQHVVMDGLLQSLAKEPSGTPAHSTRFVIVDRNGNMRAFEDATTHEAVQKTLLDIGSLLRERTGVNSKEEQTPQK
ncbi:MAG: SCO family protein [Chthoniobacterales bacterium]